ncbi:MAG TPA: Ig-like domain-containing protein [Anaerolineales bacterium]
MKNRRLTFFLLVLLVIFSAGILYVWGTPRLLAVSPAVNASGVPSGASLRLTFSRPMQSASVTERLSLEPTRKGAYTWDGNTLVFTPSQAWPSGQSIHVRLASGARAAGLLSFTLRDPVDWTFTIGHPRLVYLYPAGGAANLYLLDLLSGKSEPLTALQQGVQEYDINPSGTRIYFSTPNSQGGSDLYLLELAQSGVMPSTDQATPTPEKPAAPVLVLACEQDSCRNPQINHQGDLLAYERTGGGQDALAGSPQVWLLPTAAGTAGASPAPSLAGDPGHTTLQPSWSTGGLLAFYDPAALAYVLLDPYSRQSALFSNQAGQPGAWDPDGQAYVAPEISGVAVSRAITNSVTTITNSRLIRFNRTDGKTRDLSQADDVEDGNPAFSPDGKVLAFSRRYLDPVRLAPGRQLWLMLANGQDARPLTNDPNVTNYEFAWSPDGSQLAYVRFDQTALIEPPELWIVRPDGTGDKQLVVGGYNPQWIP